MMLDAIRIPIDTDVDVRGVIDLGTGSPTHSRTSRSFATTILKRL